MVEAEQTRKRSKPVHAPDEEGSAVMADARFDDDASHSGAVPPESSTTPAGGMPARVGTPADSPEHETPADIPERAIKLEPGADDDLPEPLNDGGAGNGPWPGAPCVTIAQCGGGGRGQTLFVNRYGEPRYPWFQLSTIHHLPKGISVKDLPDISQAHNRALDYPINRTLTPNAKQFGRSEIQGLLGLVWMFPEDMPPKEAVELLNPEKVKNSKKLTTLKERRGKRLQAYPTTYVWLKFNTSAKTLLYPLESGPDVYTNWNTGGAYRRCYDQRTFAKEKEIYACAKRQMERFEAWYNQIPAQDRQGSVLEVDYQRDPTPFPMADSRGASVPTPVRSEAADTESQSQSQRPDSGEDDEEPTEEELKQEMLSGWKRAKGISGGTLSKRNQTLFNMYYEAYLAGQG